MNLHRLFWLGCTLLIACPSLGSAQDGGLLDCDQPPSREVLAITPTDGARGVSLNAPVLARYSENYFENGIAEDELARLITLRVCDETSLCGIDCLAPTSVPGRIQRQGDDVIFEPDVPWGANRVYSGTANASDGNLDFAFCTGTTDDVAPPAPATIRDITTTAVSPESEASRCDAPNGGYRISVQVPRNSFPDDGAPGSVEYLLFQTRGQNIDAPILRNRVRLFATTADVTLAFILPIEDAGAPICLQVATVDGLGNLSFGDAASAEQCIDPIEGNFFMGLCQLNPQTQQHTGIGFFFAMAITLWFRRRRRKA